MAIEVSAIAQRFFDQCHLEMELDDALMSAFGADPEDTTTWPAGDFGYDDYDNSFELWGTRTEFEPTAAQLEAVWALGFSRGWICYRDGTEIYVGRGGVRGERKPSRHSSDADGKRQERQHRRHLESLSSLAG